jgi:hypothetical protein
VIDTRVVRFHGFVFDPKCRGSRHPVDEAPRGHCPFVPVSAVSKLDRAASRCPPPSARTSPAVRG